MATITLGHAGRKPVMLDLKTLLPTRLLITANSGGGKSWLLRRMAEQLFGKIQVVIIDPEGEFSSLREKHDYVLVGPGGETPADVRSAALVATKLLELRASAVCDLFEMKPVSDRHRWVQVFLDALIDSPKRLWHPMIVVVDEAHTFAPEKRQGESVASEAMAALASKGRKRGFAAVLATQRLSKLSKNVSANLLNRLIGMHFEDVDVDRALDLLGIPKAERLQAAQEMRLFEPGTFWAFGRAITKERMLFNVGPVHTTHPDVAQKVQAPPPPPAPEKVRKLLPALADLPKQAEDQAKDIAGARRKIAELERELRARPIHDLVDYWLKSPQLGKAERLILQALADVYPSSLSKEEVAERTSYVATGGGFLNALGKLRTLELIKGSQALSASEDLFG